MFSAILVPVDLAHTDELVKAIQLAGDMARGYGAPLYFVGVTAAAASDFARDPKDYGAELEAFAKEHGTRMGLQIQTRVAMSQTPAYDVDGALMGEIDAIGADLVVMASHVPGFAEHIFASRAGYLASHAKVSVFVVR